jgi:membrane-associated phospholipid phosphatase
MIKDLLVLAWPAALAVIAAVAWLLARHATGRAGLAGQDAARSVEGYGEDARGGGALPPQPERSAGRHGPPRSASSAVAEAARFCTVVIAGSAVTLAVMLLLGKLAAHAGPAIDKPFYQWIVGHRVHAWASLMRRATKIGNSQATWGAAGAAAACLAVTWRRRRWLPPLALGSLFVVNKLLSHTVHHVVHRVGTPTSPLGTFPSGGSARAVAFYGLIAYLLWREFSGSRRGAIWAAAAVAALGFNEGYSRGYLGLHWLTDVLGGWLYGCLLLAVFITAVRSAAGRARVPIAAQAWGPGAGPGRVPAGGGSPGGVWADDAPAGEPTAAAPATAGTASAGRAGAALPKRQPRATGVAPRRQPWAGGQAPGAHQPPRPPTDPASGGPA